MPLEALAHLQATEEMAGTVIFILAVLLFEVAAVRVVVEGRVAAAAPAEEPAVQQLIPEAPEALDKVLAAPIKRGVAEELLDILEMVGMAVILLRLDVMQHPVEEVAEEALAEFITQAVLLGAPVVAVCAYLELAQQAVVAQHLQLLLAALVVVAGLLAQTVPAEVLGLVVAAPADVMAPEAEAAGLLEVAALAFVGLCVSCGVFAVCEEPHHSLRQTLELNF